MSNTNLFLPILHLLKSLLSQSRILPFTHLPRPETLASSWIPLILTFHIQGINRSCHIYLWNIARIQPLLFTSTATTLVQTIIIFCLYYCNGLLIDPRACILCGVFATQQLDSVFHFLLRHFHCFPSYSVPVTSRPMLPLTKYLSIHLSHPVLAQWLPCFSSDTSSKLPP